MTKLVTVRVMVPCDDAVSTSDLQGELVKLLETLPVSRLGASPEEGDAGRRIHWSAVAVLRGAERVSMPPAKPRGVGKAPGQGTLS